MSISTLCRACSDSTGESLTSLPSISMLWSELQPVPAACRRALRVCLSWVGTAKWANPKLSRGLCNSWKLQRSISQSLLPWTRITIPEGTSISLVSLRGPTQDYVSSRAFPGSTKVAAIAAPRELLRLAAGERSVLLIHCIKDRLCVWKPTSLPRPMLLSAELLSAPLCSKACPNGSSLRRYRPISWAEEHLEDLPIVSHAPVRDDDTLQEPEQYAAPQTRPAVRSLIKIEPQKWNLQWYWATVVATQNNAPNELVATQWGETRVLNCCCWQTTKECISCTQLRLSLSESSHRFLFRCSVQNWKKLPCT